MLASIGRYAPAIVAGSALSGLGLAFGRDVYRKAKDKWFLVVFLVCLVGVFFSGMWLFRNYRTIAGAIFKRIGALIVLVVSLVGVNVTSAAVLLFLGINVSTSNGGFLASPLLYVVIIQIVCFVAGAMLGVKHRIKRTAAWEAEDHNNAFMEAHGLQVTDTDDKGNLRIREIATNAGYRLMENLNVTGEMEFMALGRRNKRAYIQYDETGKFVHWTGMVAVK